MSLTFYIILGWLCCSEWTNVIPQSNGLTRLFCIRFIWNALEGLFGYIWQLSGCTATRCCSLQWICDIMFKLCTTQHVLQCTFSVEGYLPLFKYIGKESKNSNINHFNICNIPEHWRPNPGDHDFFFFWVVVKGPLGYVINTEKWVTFWYRMKNDIIHCTPAE